MKRKYGGEFTVKDKILNRIKRSKVNVFIPSDFKGIATYPQVLRALKQLTDSKILIRLGYGAYAKADLNPFNNKIYPVDDNVSTAMELFKKLNVKWDYSKAVKDYNAGISTQVPVRNYIEIKDRFSRKLDVLGGAYVVR
ncbi:hypothetical protein AGMMS49982_06770 [Bacteroidia bacterium]|nr:hypothetical protein AGMMS49982_06770 [Bacteroidia bacterium]